MTHSTGTKPLAIRPNRISNPIMLPGIAMPNQVCKLMPANRQRKISPMETQY
ncbi:Uncharacterised protein [Vibrio cholerae]|nr:Uncharacterised protein [Vibrio cholerae]